MKKKKINWKHWLPFYIMFIPGLIYMIVNNYMPLYGMQLAFKSFSYSKGIAGSKWIGFKNFKFLFATKDAFIMVRNTLLYNILWQFPNEMTNPHLFQIINIQNLYILS